MDAPPPSAHAKSHAPPTSIPEPAKGRGPGQPPREPPPPPEPARSRAGARNCPTPSRPREAKTARLAPGSAARQLPTCAWPCASRKPKSAHTRSASAVRCRPSFPDRMDAIWHSADGRLKLRSIWCCASMRESVAPCNNHVQHHFWGKGSASPVRADPAGPRMHEGLSAVTTGRFEASAGLQRALGVELRRCHGGAGHLPPGEAEPSTPATPVAMGRASPPCWRGRWRASAGEPRDRAGSAVAVDRPGPRLPGQPDLAPREDGALDAMLDAITAPLPRPGIFRVGITCTVVPPSLSALANAGFPERTFPSVGRGDPRPARTGSSLEFGGAPDRGPDPRLRRQEFDPRGAGKATEHGFLRVPVARNLNTCAGLIRRACTIHPFPGVGNLQALCKGLVRRRCRVRPGCRAAIRERRLTHCPATALRSILMQSGCPEPERRGSRPVARNASAEPQTESRYRGGVRRICRCCTEHQPVPVDH